MASKAKYTVIGIRARGEPRQIERTYQGAPSEAKIANWLRGSDSRGRYDMAVRYYPSRKGWMVIDLRSAFVTTTRDGRTTIWRGIRRSKRAYPSEAAAIMKAIHTLNPPTQQVLNL